MPDTGIMKIEKSKDSISNLFTGKDKKKYGRFVFAALGSIQ